MSQPRDIFAKNLKKNRRKCGFSQAKLADKVNVSTHHIAMIELARNFPLLYITKKNENM
jgi:DNA-binding XRE family transcriptional regulator